MTANKKEKNNRKKIHDMEKEGAVQMKKFIQEFKKFALRGNVVDLAIGVIIGGAFQSIVSSLTDNILTPLLSLVGGNKDVKGLAIALHGGAVMDFGAVISAIVNFLLMAFVLFLIVKTMNKISQIGQKKEEEKPTTKTCPYCQSEINIKATKCPCCTSDLEE